MLCAGTSLVRAMAQVVLGTVLAQGNSHTITHQLHNPLTYTAFTCHVQNKANPKHCSNDHFLTNYSLPFELLLLISYCINKQGEKKKKNITHRLILLLAFKKGILNLSGSCTKNLLHHLLAEILLLWIYIVLKGHWLFKS